MEQLVNANQTVDWWKYPLTPSEDTDVDHAWAFLLVNKKVEQGPFASVTGNIITLFSELSSKNPHWKDRLEVEHSRLDKKYDQIYKKVHYLTRSGTIKKKFLEDPKPFAATKTPSFKEDTESAQSSLIQRSATAAGNYEAPTTASTSKPVDNIEMADQEDDDLPMSQQAPPI